MFLKKGYPLFPSKINKRLSAVFFRTDTIILTTACACLTTNDAKIVMVILARNAWHSLTEKTVILWIKIYEMSHLRIVFMKIGFANPVAVMRLSTTDEDFFYMILSCGIEFPFLDYVPIFHSIYI